jgi:hypothetical protein
MLWRNRWAAVVGLVVAASAVMSACGASAGPAAKTAPDGTTVPGGAGVPTGLPAGFRPEALVRVGDSEAVVVAGAAPCGKMECAALVRGSLGPHGLVRRWRRLHAPPIAAARNLATLNLGRFVFANAQYGYDVVPPSAPGGATHVYATSDGGASWWAPITAGTVLTLVAAPPSGFYAVTARCGTQSCDDYQLARSTAGSTHWSSAPMPATTGLDGNPIGLAVSGNEVLVNFDPPVAGGEAHLLIASGGRPPFEVHLVPQLVSVAACDLSPQPGGAVWASCPTGMMVSYLRAPSPAGPYTSIWDYAGTGGGGLVPVTGKVAYRYTGIPELRPDKLPGDTLQRSTDAGRSFVDPGPWPFAHSTGTTPQFLFLNRQDGFGLGQTRATRATVAVFQTDDAARHWTQVLP